MSYSVQTTRRSTSKPFKCPDHNEELSVGTGYKQEKTGSKRMQGAGPLGVRVTEVHPRCDGKNRDDPHSCDPALRVSANLLSFCIAVGIPHGHWGSAVVCVVRQRGIRPSSTAGSIIFLRNRHGASFAWGSRGSSAVWQEAAGHVVGEGGTDELPPSRVAKLGRNSPEFSCPSKEARSLHAAPQKPRRCPTTFRGCDDQKSFIDES